MYFFTSTSGATFYVDSANGHAGDSPAHGSETHPWRTVAYGIARMPSGGLLYVRAGTYQQAGLYFPGNRSGTASSPTRIEAYPGEVVTLSGTGLNTGRVKITGCSHLIFDGFIVTNFNQGIYVEACTNVTVQNCTVHDVGQEGIHINGNSSGITIQNCVVFDTGRWRYNGEGIYVGTGSSGPLDNTALVTIRSNLVHDVGTGYGGEAIELKPGTHDCVIEHNTIFHAASEPGAGAIEIGESVLGVQSWASNPNHTVRNNLLHDVHTAIRAGTGCLIYNNVVYGITNGSPGIYVNSPANDSYPRRIYHNTIDLPEGSAVRVMAGTIDERNNIGPAYSNNIAADASFFVNAAAGDYHLVPGSKPINVGADLSAIVPADFDGNPRPEGPAADLGAYEYAPRQVVSPDSLKIQH